jgi:hypothetical protein
MFGVKDFGWLIGSSLFQMGSPKVSLPAVM